MGKRTNTAVWLDKYKRWQINVQKDGIRKTFSSSKPGRTGQREANAKADQWLDADIQNTCIKVKELYTDYLESVKATTSVSNYMKADSIGKNWILPNIGHLQISKLTLLHLQKIIDKACAKGLSRKTLSNIRATIAAFIKYCRKAKATELICEDLSIPHSARYKGKQILQPDELKILFSVDTTLYRGKRIYDELVNAYRFQVLTGLRPGELLGLRWTDIDGSIVNVRHSKNWLGEFTDGKNENAIRRFILCTQAEQILQAQAKLTRFRSIFVFDDISQELYRHRFQQYCKSNGITPITPYELRHTFVSIAKALPEGDIKNLVGHSANMDTFGTYGHEVSGDLERVSESLSNVFQTVLYG
ncbi:MAG: tyrosine-type recombinase/integrase [Clostridia bacterium]|nr:tyrosine-type recombinase/integrase [Clostridia bacterium]